MNWKVFPREWTTKLAEIASSVFDSRNSLTGYHVSIYQAYVSNALQALEKFWRIASRDLSPKIMDIPGESKFEKLPKYFLQWRNGCTALMPC